MPTFPWKNNYVSSSEYVNADDSIETSLYDVSSSESVDDDESKDSSLETFYTGTCNYNITEQNRRIYSVMRTIQSIPYQVETNR